MRHITKFGTWMRANGYTYRQLADELGIGQDMIYALASGRRQAGLSLQIKFINRFGRDEAAKVFDDSPVLAVLETA